MIMPLNYNLEKCMSILYIKPNYPFVKVLATNEDIITSGFLMSIARILSSLYKGCRNSKVD